MATLRPQEVELLIAITKQISGSFDFTNAAQELGITTSAASQRWGRLKTKIIGKQEILLKSGDEHTLLVNIAKQFGAGHVNFEVVGAQIGTSAGAATQRWGRLRTKIMGGKGKAAAAMVDSLKNPDYKVIKPPPKPKSTTPKSKVLKPYPYPKPKKEKTPKKSQAKSKSGDPKEEENLDDLAEAQLHEKRASAVEQGYEADEAMYEYADAQAEEAALASDQDTEIRFHSDDEA